MLGILLDNDVDNDDNDDDNADVFNGEKANDDNGDCPNPPVRETVQLLLYFNPSYSTELHQNIANRADFMLGFLNKQN